MNSLLIKELLIKKKNENNSPYFTEEQNQYSKIGNNLYMVRTLYIIAKEYLYKDKNKKLNFYLRIKNEDKKPISFPKPKDDDIIIEEYKELIDLIIDSCSFVYYNKYKIHIYTDNLLIIETNDQLLSYKGRILYAKIKEYKNKISDINIKNKSYDMNILYNKNNTNKNTIKGGRIKIFRKFILNKKNFPINNNKLTIKLKNINKPKIDNININKDNYNYEQQMLKLESIYYRNNKSNSIENKKSSNISGISISSVKENISNYSDLFKNNSQNDMYQDNENKNNESSVKSSLLFEEKKINDNNNNSNINVINNNTNAKLKISKSKSEFDFLKYRNDIFFKKLTNKRNLKDNIRKKFYNDLLFKSIEQNKNDNVFDNQKIKDKKISRNNKENKIIRNNSDSISNKRYSSSILRKNNSYNLIMPKFLDKGNQIEIIHNKNLSNQSAIIKNYFKINKNDEDIFLIKKFLNSSSKNITFISKKDNENKDNNSENIKRIYKSCLYEINYIINNINHYFSENEINIFIKHLDYSYRKKFAFINIRNCLKQFLLFSYFEHYIKEKYPSLLNEITKKPTNEITNEEIENLLNYLLNEIKERKKNQDFKLIEYVQSMKLLQKITLNKDFFFVFVLCSDFFKEFQKEIGKKMILTLEIEDKLYFENYVNYYLYFKENKLITIEMKMNFIIKFLYIVQGGSSTGQDGQSIKKFNDDIQYEFKIDNRTKMKLLGKVYDIKLNYHMIAKVNEIFSCLISFFYK